VGPMAIKKQTNVKMLSNRAVFRILSVEVTKILTILISIQRTGSDLVSIETETGRTLAISKLSEVQIRQENLKGAKSAIYSTLIFTVQNDLWAFFSQELVRNRLFDMPKNKSVEKFGFSKLSPFRPIQKYLCFSSRN